MPAEREQQPVSGRENERKRTVSGQSAVLTTIFSGNPERQLIQTLRLRNRLAPAVVATA
jgi:hypothetical protein